MPGEEFKIDPKECLYISSFRGGTMELANEVSVPVLAVTAMAIDYSDVSFVLVFKDEEMASNLIQTLIERDANNNL